MPDLWNTLHSRLLLIHRYVDDAGANSSIKDSFAIHTCTFHPIGVKGCPYAPNCQIQKKLRSCLEVSRNYFWAQSVELPWWRVTTHADLESATDWVDHRAKFASRNQKNYSGSDTSKVWNFCTRSSDVISRGNQSCCREMSAVFLGCSEVFMYLLKFARKISLMMILTFKLLANFCCLTELKH